MARAAPTAAGRAGPRSAGAQRPGGGGGGGEWAGGCGAVRAGSWEGRHRLGSGARLPASPSTGRSPVARPRTEIRVAQALSVPARRVRAEASIPVVYSDETWIPKRCVSASSQRIDSIYQHQPGRRQRRLEGDADGEARRLGKFRAAGPSESDTGSVSESVALSCESAALSCESAALPSGHQSPRLTARRCQIQSDACEDLQVSGDHDHGSESQSLVLYGGLMDKGLRIAGNGDDTNHDSTVLFVCVWPAASKSSLTGTVS